MLAAAATSDFSETKFVEKKSGWEGVKVSPSSLQTFLYLQTKIIIKKRSLAEGDKEVCISW